MGGWQKSGMCDAVHMRSALGQQWCAYLPGLIKQGKLPELTTIVSVFATSGLGNVVCNAGRQRPR